MNDDNYEFLNTELINHYRKIMEIRKHAIERLIEAKQKYVETGQNDDFILSMYDNEIAFIKASVKSLQQKLN